MIAENNNNDKMKNSKVAYIIYLYRVLFLAISSILISCLSTLVGLFVCTVMPNKSNEMISFDLANNNNENENNNMNLKRISFFTIIVLVFFVWIRQKDSIRMDDP